MFLLKPSGVCVATVLVALGVAVEAQAQAKPKLESLRPKVACSAMAGHMVPAASIGLPTRGATIKATQIKGPSGVAGAPDYLPEYCNLVGIISPVNPKAPVINFAVNIPTLWNQKAWHFGGQGFNGIIPVNLENVVRHGQPDFRAGSPLNATYPPNAPTPLGTGYATFGGDSGHENPPAAPPGTAPADPAPMPDWMWNDEAWTNLTYAGLKKTHDASQAVIKAMYGTDSRVTYFGGQSHGGREALFVANMFPGDYEGVIAAGPLAYWAAWVIGEGFRVKMQIEPGAWVPPAKGAAIRDETLRLCDALDGLADGAVHNYMACNRKLDPTITPNPLANIRCPGGTDAGDHCLSDKQMETVNAWHAPVKYPYAFANGETDFPGLPTGGEGPQGWLLTQRQPTATSTAGRPNFLSGGLRDKNLTNGIKVDPVAHREKIQNMSKLMDARPDWSKLLARGSKLIYYTPGSDYLISARAQHRVYEEALKKSGQAAFERGVRYYVGPGLGHGGAGNDAKGRPLPQFADLVGVLENWVENGVTPPDPIVQTVMEPKPPFTETRSRPLCRYPAYPHYNGSGDPNVAASYSCRTTEGATSSR